MTAAERADSVFGCYCEYLDGKGLRYKKDADERKILLQMTGANLPVTLLLSVEEDNERTFVFAKLPFDVSREKRVDLAMAVTYINAVLATGTFCVDADGGYVSYESNELYTGLHGFTAAYAERVIVSAFSAVDMFNDQLFAVNKGLLTVKEFAAQM